MRVAVIGGGIAGLAAAYEVRRAEPGATVVVFEASARLGGKLRTTPFAGRFVDEGADAFLARVPWAVELCDELGLREELVSPAQRTAYLWTGGALRPLPDGHVLGVPTDPDALAASGLVSADAVARVRAELRGEVTVPWPTGDPSVGALVRSRLGDEILERLVDPLLGGVNAGDTDRLSLAAGAPQLAAAAALAAAGANGGSLAATLGAQRAAAGEDRGAPVFYTVPGGVERLVDRLAERAAADVRFGAAVDALDEVAAGFDGVVVATPAAATAHLLSPVAPAAADVLRSIAYALVAIVTLAYAADAVGHPLDASGFLVPRTEPMTLTACSWATSKWAHLDRRDGTVVLRASAGRWGDDSALALDDSQLVDRLHDDLTRTMDLAAPPLEARVSRWPMSFPQYEPGHLDRIDAVEAELAAQTPRVVLAGAAYRGLGIPACIRSGRDAATALLTRL